MMSARHLFLRRLLPLLVAVALPVAGASAQKLGSRFLEDKHNGYRFKHPADWAPVPVIERLAGIGVVLQLDGELLSSKVGDSNMAGLYKPTLLVFLFKDKAVLTPGADGGSLKRRVKTETRRDDIAEFIDRSMSSLRDFDPEAPLEDEEREIDDVPVRHRTWSAFDGNFDVLIDTWTFRLPDFDIVMMYDIPQQHERKWMRSYEQSARTFELIERTEAVTLGKRQDYDSLLKYHADEASRTPGWRVLETPSKKYIIKTSSDDDKFLKEVIDRLEKSRELYEADFPPSPDFDTVSVVRICSTRDEFNTYGGTGGGTAGWFSPQTLELVLFDAQENNRNMTYAVMTHEAFHQYCHFLFEEAESHRWFDEGHGDYYGGIEFKGSRAKITPRMPGGLDRLPRIREMIRTNDFVPLEEHINYTHPEWQSHSVDSYCQSWSIIYMLRQGMNGKVHRKVWRDEYADIIPNYVSTLLEGYQEAYAEVRKEREELAEAADEELDEEDLKVTRFDIPPSRRDEIWKKAMAAAWGPVDVKQFESDWTAYVEKYLD